MGVLFVHGGQVGWHYLNCGRGKEEEGKSKDDVVKVKGTHCLSSLLFHSNVILSSKH